MTVTWNWNDHCKSMHTTWTLTSKTAISWALFSFGLWPPTKCPIELWPLEALDNTSSCHQILSLRLLLNHPLHSKSFSFSSTSDSIFCVFSSTTSLSRCYSQFCTCQLVSTNNHTNKHTIDAHFLFRRLIPFSSSPWSMMMRTRNDDRVFSFEHTRALLQLSSLQQDPIAAILPTLIQHSFRNIIFRIYVNLVNARNSCSVRYFI